jgi:tetratricopeptide (TPR) repeat protein
MRTSGSQFKRHAGRRVDSVICATPSCARRSTADRPAARRFRRRRVDGSATRIGGRAHRARIVSISPAWPRLAPGQLLDAAAERAAQYLEACGHAFEVAVSLPGGSARSGPAEHHRTQAIDAYKRALRLNDRGVAAWLNLAINDYERARQPRNDDAEADLGRALEALERGRVLDPGSFVPYFYEGEVHALLAERKTARGIDPAPDRALALAAYRKGLTINSRLPHLYNGIASVQSRAAQDAMDHGRDPTELLGQAYDAAAQAIAVAPDQGYGYNNLGDVLARRAVFERAQGRDPAQHTASAGRRSERRGTRSSTGTAVPGRRQTGR